MVWRMQLVAEWRCLLTHGMAAVVVAAVAAACAGCGPGAPQAPLFHPSTPAEAAALSYYIDTVKPVLQSNCYRCHYGLNRQGGFNLGTRALVLHGGNHGPAALPGDPDSSLLLVVLRHQGPADHPMPMPKKGEKLPESQLEAIAKWVAEGVVMER